MRTLRRYQKYIGGCSIHSGFQYKLKGFYQLAPHMHYDIPLMYSRYPPMYLWYPTMYLWYPPDVLNISQCTHDIPHMHHDIPRCIEHTLYRVVTPIVRKDFCDHENWDSSKYLEAEAQQNSGVKVIRHLQTIQSWIYASNITV